MENNSITKLILAFLVLIVGLALIGSVASNSIAVTQKSGISSEIVDIAPARLAGCGPGSINETYNFTLAQAPTGWKASGGCPITSFTMVNQTSVAATVTTDYTLFGANGSLYLVNSSTFVLLNCSAGGTDWVSNTTTVNYIYCGNDYLNIAWGRTVLNLVAGFFALALLGASVGLFYSVAKDTGII